MAASARLARPVSETRSGAAVLAATGGSEVVATVDAAVSVTPEVSAGAGTVAEGHGCSVAPGGQAGLSGLQSGHSHGRNGLNSGVSAVYGHPFSTKLIGTKG